MKLLNITIDSKILIATEDNTYYLILNTIGVGSKPLRLISHGRKAVGFSSVKLSKILCELYGFDPMSKNNNHLYVDITAREIMPGVLGYLIHKNFYS
jgi:hypothetical protein